MEKPIFRNYFFPNNKKILKRAICIFFIISIQWQSLYSQTITPLLPGFDGTVLTITYDSLNNLLYAGGAFDHLAQSGIPMSHISKWNGLQWDSLGAGVSDNGIIMSMVMFGNDLIVGGNFQEMDGINASGIAKWNGNNWEHFADAISNQGSACVFNLDVIDSTLFVTGCFDSINGMAAKGIARFDGVNWFSYPNFPATTHYINDVIKFNNEIYIGGNFNAGVGKSDIMKFDGVNWVDVGGGFTGANTNVNSFEIYQNKLFVGGYFQVGGGDPANNIAIWDGTTWSQPGNGLMPANVYEMHVFGNKLYACGQINDASGIPVSFIAVWDGFSWNSFNGYQYDNLPRALYSRNNTLFMGGSFTTINGDPYSFIAIYEFPLSINELLNSKVKIIPNPANDKLSIEFISNYELQKGELAIFDLTGRKVFSKELESAQNKIEIDISFLDVGSYQIAIDSENYRVSKQLMVIR